MVVMEGTVGKVTISSSRKRFALPKLVANVASISTLFVHERTRDSALVSMIWTHSVDAKIKLNYVEFVRRFSNGSMLQTNNSSRVGSFVSSSNHLTLQLPQVKNVLELHRIHVRACESFGTGRPVLTLIDDFQGDVEAFIQDRVLELPAVYQVQRGLLQKVEGGYGMTWFGAYVLVWQELFPIKQLIRWRCQVRSKSWLEKHGIPLDSSQ